MVMVEATIAGRPYRLTLDTGAARTQLTADEYTSALRPVGEDASSGTFGGRVTRPLVTIADLVVGPLRIAALDVTRSGRTLDQAPGTGILGMDVLGRYCCHFRLAAGVVDLGLPPGTRPDNTLTPGPRGHVYLDAHWPGVSAWTCWDTGAGATVVDRAFWLSHPELFEQVGVSAGTDVNGDQVETPLLLMAGPVIGQRTFSRHKVVVVDLSQVNGPLEHPMDLILGYPTIRQADWLFDFPARRWTITSHQPQD